MSPNRLQRQFNPDAPDERWVTDITYIRTHEGWLYLAVVVDLFSRKIIGWSMQSRMTKDIVLNALLMAVWRRNPEKQVLVHSDQGSQYTSHEWQSFLKSHGLEGSMSRRGNCHDNAVAESFFQLLKRERIKKKIYGTREEARSDIFDYIEMFYNSKRRHGSLANRCHRQNMKTSIINGSEVSRLSVAIHYVLRQRSRRRARSTVVRADRHLPTERYRSGSVSAPYPERTAGMAFQPS